VVLIFSKGIIHNDSMNPVIAPAITNLGAEVLPWSVAINLEAELKTMNLEPAFKPLPKFKAPHPLKKYLKERPKSNCGIFLVFGSGMYECS
jgi:hypothetical protein